MQHNFHSDGGTARPSAAPIYAAARLYYDEALSQQEVAERLGVSRSTVSRLLQLARDQDIVRIEVRLPSPDAELSAQLAGSLRIRRAVVVSAPKGGRQTLVGPVLEELERLRLAPGDVLAISWGQAISEVAAAHRFPDLRGVTVVPAIGGMDETDGRFQTNEIARRVADASGADVSFLHVPAVPSPRLRRSLLADPEIAARLALWDGLAAVLVGVGGPPSQLTSAPAHVTAHRGELAAAVGDVAARHFDLYGSPVELPHEERQLGVSRAQLQGAGTVIAVAADPAKAQSLVGAARAGLIDVLVTDAATATAVLDLLDGRAP